MGRLFELHPVAGGRAAPPCSIWILTAVQAAARPAEVRYTPIRRYPSSGVRSFGGGRATANWWAICTASWLRWPVRCSNRSNISANMPGPPLPEGAKSVSFRVTVGSAERTLASEEVGAIRARLIEGMRAQGYDLRL